MQVQDIDAGSPNSGKVTASSKVEQLERTVIICLSVLIAALALSLIALAAYTAVLVLTEDRSPRPCVSEQCVGTATRILQNMNKDVNPCTDFYEFACGSWIKHNPRPDWAGYWNEVVKLKGKMYSDLRELLEVKDDKGLPNSVVKAKSLYRMCMSPEKLEADGMKPIQKVLQELGLPPGPPTEMSANFSWEEVAGRSRRLLGLNLLFIVKVATGAVTDRKRFEIDQLPSSSLHLLRTVYAQYHNSIQSSINNETDAQQFADGVMEFTKKLSLIVEEEERRNDTRLFLDLSVKQLKEGPNGPPPQWKQHDWGRYLTMVFSNTSVALQDRDRVYVQGLPYLQKLSVLLANTKPVIIERYLWWMVFSTGARALERIRKQRTRHWMDCTAEVNKHFGHALSYLYVKRHFDFTSTKKAIEMLEDVRSAFAATVQELDWLDSTTRQKVLDKLTAMKKLVSFPTWLLTPELDKYYEDAEVVEGNIFETNLKLTNWYVKRSLESLREKPNRSRWVLTATEVNAFYAPYLNSVTIPAAILQMPFYGNGIEAINYGSIGHILGHEITHGFDTYGRRYDKEGNQKEWWSNATLKHYERRVRCIIDQYNKYNITQLPGYHVDGNNTQGENIADNGGLRAAFHAYQLFAKRAPADSRVTLPGLSDYKPDQLFFLGFAQALCENSTIQAQKYQIESDVHSPKKFRVIGTLSNFKEFADAWSCPAGSPMNPEHKCALW